MNRFCISVFHFEMVFIMKYFDIASPIEIASALYTVICT